MRSFCFEPGLTVARLIASAVVATALSDYAAASSFTIVAQLGQSGPIRDNGGIWGQLAVDSHGNLYAEPFLRASAPVGAVYLLKAKSGYTKASMLYDFGNAPFTEYDPYGGVTVTPANEILGTTGVGGTGDGGAVLNLGLASEISYGLLHMFSGGQTSPTDGSFPGGVTRGLFNRYYGETTWGGNNATSNDPFSGDGTLYDVSSSVTNPQYELLYRFGAPGDGVNPPSVKLAEDQQGRLYGVTYSGGENGAGTVYMLQHVAGAWQEQILYSFASQNDLNFPTANVVLDAKGNVYGCAEGGTHGQGGIFEISPPVQDGAPRQERVLYNFGDRKHDPVAARPGEIGDPGVGCGITMDQTTNLIVGTSFGGGLHGGGTIFTLAPPSGHQKAWVETIGYSFEHPQQTGTEPVAPPLEVNGVYYGSTTSGLGQIYAFTP
jgi:hypothetical protein